MKTLSRVTATVCLMALALVSPPALSAQVDNSTQTRVSPWPIRSTFPGRCQFGDTITLSTGSPGSNIYQCGNSNDWNLVAGGGTGSPGGTNGQWQFNTSGVFGGFTPQVNGTGITTPSTLNFLNSNAFNGLTLNFTNSSGGNVQLGASGTLNNAGLTNSATTVNGQTCALGGTCTVAAGGSAPGTCALTLTSNTVAAVNLATCNGGNPGTAMSLALSANVTTWNAPTNAQDGQEYPLYITSTGNFTITAWPSSFNDMPCLAPGNTVVNKVPLFYLGSTAKFYQLSSASNSAGYFCMPTSSGPPLPPPSGINYGWMNNASSPNTLNVEDSSGNVTQTWTQRNWTLLHSTPTGTAAPGAGTTASMTVTSTTGPVATFCVWTSNGNAASAPASSPAGSTTWTLDFTVGTQAGAPDITCAHTTNLTAGTTTVQMTVPNATAAAAMFWEAQGATGLTPTFDAFATAGNAASASQTAPTPAVTGSFDLVVTPITCAGNINSAGVPYTLTSSGSASKQAGTAVNQISYVPAVFAIASSAVCNIGVEAFKQ